DVPLQHHHADASFSDLGPPFDFSFNFCCYQTLIYFNNSRIFYKMLKDESVTEPTSLADVFYR
ncbi:hypothetical protein OFM21_26870, partial [Escherichia coli]|nr:hypothetical protein [Escherichia coli]